MFCGNDWSSATAGCSLANHCKNGPADCPAQKFCFSAVQCDARSFIPHEKGGWLGGPSNQELAQSMGLAYPSDDVSGAAPTRGLTNSHQKPVAMH
jgi:hypothetical protein